MIMEYDLPIVIGITGIMVTIATFILGMILDRRMHSQIDNNEKKRIENEKNEKKRSIESQCRMILRIKDHGYKNFQVQTAKPDGNESTFKVVNFDIVNGFIDSSSLESGTKEGDNHLNFSTYMQHQLNLHLSRHP